MSIPGRGHATDSGGTRVAERGRPFLSCVVAVLLLAPPATVRAQRPDDPWPQMLAKVRGAFADSGHRAVPAVSHLRFASDTASQQLLERIGIRLPVSSRSRDICPGSTDSTGRAVTGSTGYTVSFRASRAVAPDTLRTFGLGWSCTYLSRGHPRGFHEGFMWTMMRRGPHWVISDRVAVDVT